jgi:hypothetical protein
LAWVSGLRGSNASAEDTEDMNRSPRGQGAGGRGGGGHGLEASSPCSQVTLLPFYPWDCTAGVETALGSCLVKLSINPGLRAQFWGCRSCL